MCQQHSYYVKREVIGECLNRCELVFYRSTFSISADKTQNKCDKNDMHLSG